MPHISIHLKKYISEQVIFAKRHGGFFLFQTCCCFQRYKMENVDEIDPAIESVHHF